MIRYYLAQPKLTDHSDFKIRFEVNRENAGIDLYCVNSVSRELPPGGRGVFHTGLYLAMPWGVEAQIRGRSGLTRDHGVTPMVGTVDPGYRGEISVVVFNLGDKPYTINPTDRFAQLVFAPTIPYCFGMHADMKNKIAGTPVIDLYQVEFKEVFSLAELGDTVRGRAGFGSTGR